MKAIVTGDREWGDVETVRLELSMLPFGSIVIHGACRGLDLMAAKVARELGLTPIAYPAEWGRYGRAAGPIRNQKMVDENLDADIVLAFHRNIEESKGTKDMIERCKAAGLEVRLCL